MSLSKGICVPTKKDILSFLWRRPMMTCSTERQFITEKPLRQRLHFLAPLRRVWPCDCLLVTEVSQHVPLAGWSSEKQMCAFSGWYPLWDSNRCRGHFGTPGEGGTSRAK